MKLWMRIATPLTLVMGVSFQAQAQYAMMNANYGTGMPSQSCPYQESTGDGASGFIEDMKEAQKNLAEAKKQLALKKRELDKINNKDLRRNQKDIERVISSDYTDVLYEHMSNAFSCEDYRGGKSPENTIAEGQEGSKQISKNDVDPKSKHDFRPYEAGVWANDICGDRGGVKAAACTLVASQEDGITRVQVDACKKALSEYRKNVSNASKLAKEVEALKGDIEKYQEQFKTAKEDYRDEQRERTEGGGCPECDRLSNGYSYQGNRGTDWTGVGANLAVGGIATALGYSFEKQRMQSDARLGFPSQGGGALYTALGYGLPYLANGLYGAIGGAMGGGSFGCGGASGGIGGGMNGGMFGNPYGMNANVLGGGMFMPGMNGMINPYMMNGMMNPMGNMMGGMISGGAMMNGGGMMGNMMGYPGAMMGGMMNGGAMMGGGNMMGYPGAMMGYPGAMMGGMMNGGAMMGGGNMMGYPGAMMGGMMNGGAMMGGGNMMGYPGAMMGGMMNGGAMMGGGNMMGYPGAMIGGMMGAMMNGGGMMGNMMGYPGAMMNGGGMMGMPMMGSMSMDGGQAQMQYQQQMMQMQMQQYQMQMQQQQAKTQALSGLQSEMQGLAMRIWQVQNGVGIGMGSPGIIGGGLNNGMYGGGFNGSGGGTISGPGGTISGPGISNGTGNYYPGNLNNGGGSLGPYPVNQGINNGGSSR